MLDKIEELNSSMERAVWLNLTIRAMVGDEHLFCGEKPFKLLPKQLVNIHIVLIRAARTAEFPVHNAANLRLKLDCCSSNLPRVKIFLFRNTGRHIAGIVNPQRKDELLFTVNIRIHNFLLKELVTMPVTGLSTLISEYHSLLLKSNRMPCLVFQLSNNPLFISLFWL